MRQTEPYKTEAYTPKVLLLAYTGSASSLIGNDLYSFVFSIEFKVISCFSFRWHYCSFWSWI